MIKHFEGKQPQLGEDVYVSGNAMVMQRQAGRWPNADADCEVSINVPEGSFTSASAPITIAAGGFQAAAEAAPRYCFNGKIESPRKHLKS